MTKPRLLPLLLALAGTSLAMQAGAADVGAAALRCEPPVIQASMADTPTSRFLVTCKGADSTVLAPEVVFAGSLDARMTPPYKVVATYRINAQSLHGQKLSQLPREDEVAVGFVRGSTVSAATLPAQFSAQTSWDAYSGTLSIEESAGVWRVFALSASDDEPTLREAGMATAPVSHGRATVRVNLGSDRARFAAKQAPFATAELRMRDGKLEVLLGETRAANQKAVQDALLSLDRQPKDLTRAWALASVARFLELDDEVHYAEKKVAAFHPDLLPEFQAAVARIKPFNAQVK